MGPLRRCYIVLALGVAAACDSTVAPASNPAPPPARARADPISDLQSYAGRPFADLAAAYPDRFGDEALSLSADESQRLQPLIRSVAGSIVDGGGAQALVYRGCAATGCADGVAVIAVDGATGGTFAGVRDAAGKDVFVSNDRLEALLRLNAASRDWTDAAAGAAEGAPSSQAARP